MLHDQDTKMVLMNPNAPNSLFSMDIEHGKIVEEWKVHDDVTGGSFVVCSPNRS